LPDTHQIVVSLSPDLPSLHPVLPGFQLEFFLVLIECFFSVLLPGLQSLLNCLKLFGEIINGRTHDASSI
jgi:hypothetical protein